MEDLICAPTEACRRLRRYRLSSQRQSGGCGPDPTLPSLVVLKYLVRHELEATTWAFAYYKPKEQWILTGLRWYPSVAHLAL